jgi:hypothetical protein
MGTTVSSRAVRRASSFLRELSDDVPLTRRRRLGESIGEQKIDVGFGWPNGDEWSRTYVNSGWLGMAFRYASRRNLT